MRVIIAGTRTIDQYEIVLQAIRACPSERLITEVVSGAHPDHVERYLMGKRRGNPDIFGAIWARSSGTPVKFFPADWYAYGNPAGPIRNGEMEIGYPREHIFQWIITEEQLRAAQTARTQP